MIVNLKMGDYDPINGIIKGVDRLEIAPQVFIIGDIGYVKQYGEWRALANVYGSLCVIVVRVTVDGNEVLNLDVISEWFKQYSENNQKLKIKNGET